jgi:glutamyl-tRNA synthetase/glutamyl-Q tRNA(Asp) synthetase
MIRPDIDTAAVRVRGRAVTRFAPSPTGYLHLGHVVNAVYVWGLAQAVGGSVLLRVEDHDRVRSRPEFETALLEDLEWLGFLGLPATSSGRQRQSDRTPLYVEALARLRRTHHVYACDCSRARIGGERYSGRCRERRVPEGPGTGLRVQIDPGSERFEDLLLGHLEHRPAEQCGDLLIRDRTGHWTYQFAVSVDDLEQGVTLVIRGIDLLSSTGRQLRLARMLAAEERPPAATPPPVYLHHPLISGDDGLKLSKSTGAAAVRGLRATGLSSGEVIGRAAAAVGLLDEPSAIEAGRLGTLFELPVAQRDGAASPRRRRAGDVVTEPEYGPEHLMHMRKRLMHMRKRGGLA